jgi:cation diffusion facilitator family transporter
MSDQSRRGIRSAQIAILVNACLAIAKLVAGIVGHTYALVADAVESTADIFASTIVWGGLRVAARDPDQDYPFGYGKAEPLAGAVVALMLLGAAAAIAVQAVSEIRTPHRTPAPWTLIVLVTVVLVKWTLSRRGGGGRRTGDGEARSASVGDGLPRDDPHPGRPGTAARRGARAGRRGEGGDPRGGAAGAVRARAHGAFSGGVSW